MSYRIYIYLYAHIYETTTDIEHLANHFHRKMPQIKWVKGSFQMDNYFMRT